MEDPNTPPADDQTPVDPGSSNPPAEEQPVLAPDPGIPVDQAVISPAGLKEQVVNDLDTDGNIIGWHKEEVA